VKARATRLLLIYTGLHAGVLLGNLHLHHHLRLHLDGSGMAQRLLLFLFCLQLTKLINFFRIHNAQVNTLTYRLDQPPGELLGIEARRLRIGRGSRIRAVVVLILELKEIDPILKTLQKDRR
jgi:hypothetical protein